VGEDVVLKSFLKSLDSESMCSGDPPGRGAICTKIPTPGWPCVVLLLLLRFSDIICTKSEIVGSHAYERLKLGQSGSYGPVCLLSVFHKNIPPEIYVLRFFPKSVLLRNMAGSSSASGL
jgi:hypothetical protein